MDISALSDDNFNATRWINENYKKYAEEKAETDGRAENADAATSLEFIQSYVPKLQLYAEQVHYAIVETCQQSVAMLPRFTKEQSHLQAEIVHIQKRMQEMRQEIAAVQGETGECMATLERLNSLQMKLQATKESLQESDGWGNLLSALEDCFDQKDLKGACAKLVALQRSLQAQEQLAGHTERELQVEEYKNRLEALASASVVQCFTEYNLEQAQMFVEIFESMQRLPQLQQYYRAVQRSALQQLWKQTLDLESGGDTTNAHFLTLFYDQLLEHTQSQLKWCAQLFNTASSVENEVAEAQSFYVIAELLPVLQPRRESSIGQLLKSTDEKLELLAECAQANNTFGGQLNGLCSQADISLPETLRSALAEAIYGYFTAYIQQYPHLEEDRLIMQMDQLITSQASPGDAVRHLNDCTRKVFDLLREVCNRCENITSSLAICKLVAPLNVAFKRQLDHFATAQRQIRLSSGNSGSENWTMLQYTMSLLQALADFQLRLNKFEQDLHNRMSTLASKMQTQKSAKEINIYQIYPKSASQQLLKSIAEFQQKRSESAGSSNDSLGIFPNVYATLRSNYVDTHEVTLNILLQPIEVQLKNIQLRTSTQVHARSAVDMPSFSYAPQEYITQIGQYLLTLPQHLEPLLLAPSPLLKQALELCNIKYAQPTPCADVLLSLVVEQSCVLYQNQILQIKTLAPPIATQLTVDIEYLSNVLDELGLTITAQLSQILTLLKAPADNYLSLSGGCEPYLVTAIRQMRNIISTQ